MKTLLLLTLMALIGMQTAEASGRVEYLIVGHYSEHIGYKGYYEGETFYKYNETNGGLGIEYRLSKNKVIWLGNYEDSFRGPAAYIGVMQTYYRLGPYIEVGLFHGLVISQEYNRRIGNDTHTPLPFIFPAVRVQYHAVGVNLTYKPRISSDQSAIIGVMLKVKL